MKKVAFALQLGWRYEVIFRDWVREEKVDMYDRIRRWISHWGRTESFSCSRQMVLLTCCVPILDLYRLGQHYDSTLYLQISWQSLGDDWGEKLGGVVGYLGTLACSGWLSHGGCGVTNNTPRTRTTGFSR